MNNQTLEENNILIVKFDYINKTGVQAAGAKPDATPPIDKIHPFSKIALTFEPMMQFLYHLIFRMSLICVT